jgi:hypothetical protein
MRLYAVHVIGGWYVTYWCIPTWVQKEIRIADCKVALEKVASYLPNCQSDWLQELVNTSWSGVGLGGH